ncbi:amino acid transporter [Trematosphaeria pertusa]|uniref:Amino acid transporter n=1 Tax=Trematosphaeria pertusa TaxID=390896 RepID=A0A6A6ILU0_9PLEO|nr:amino acid transporter [Trematosphaeria pertusa]KAF2251585.1 amino acid transporter [Trematosphaeria pertusa]
MTSDHVQSSSRPLTDTAYLARLGKQSRLPRTFGFMSLLGFSSLSLISWEGILVTSVGALRNGGSVGVVWGFLFNWLGMLCIFGTLAELASMAPTSAGQYHWVAMMAPKRCRPFLTYLTAWQAFTATTGFLVATLLQGIVVVATSAYRPQPWHTMLLIWAVVAFAGFINSTTSRTLAKLEGGILIFHILGFFIVMIPLVYLAEHRDVAFVFEVFLNEGGWSSQALSLGVGLPATAMSLLGADSGVHISEEIQSAPKVVSRALMSTVVINGTLGFAMAIAMLFCMDDLQRTLDTEETLYYPFLHIFHSVLRSATTACVLAAIVLFMGLMSGIGVYASASRMLWAFSRDAGMPSHKRLVQLTSQSTPINAISTTVVTTVLLPLLILGSTVSFNALIGLTVAGLYSTYILVCALLLYRHAKGDIRHLEAYSITYTGLTWGPWRIPGLLGFANNLLSCLYLLFVLFWSFWPPQTPTPVEKVNFSPVIFGAVVIVCIGWYLLVARHHFKGPLRETAS